MPSGEATAPVVDRGHGLMLAELRRMLERTTVQVMRQAARQWGWTLRGTAKNDLVEQMVSYLGDPSVMAEAVRTLTEEEINVLGWLVATGLQGLSKKQFQAAIFEGSGLRISQKAIDAHLVSLSERCLLFYSEDEGYELPTLYHQWLPRLAAPKLQFAPVERLQIPSPLTIAGITQHAQHLLSMLASEQPPATVAKKHTPRYGSGKVEPIDPRRPSLVAEETLTRWGYEAPADQHLARFLLEQLANARVCRVKTERDATLMEVDDARNRAWEIATAAERLERLRRAYVKLSGEGEARLNSWSEWDMVFSQDRDETLQSKGPWVTADMVLRQIQVLGVWFSTLIAGLQTDTWYGIEQFCKLVYRTKSDLMTAASVISQFFWAVDGKVQYADQLPFDRWMTTYGRLVQAWLTGPARWLLFVQIATIGDQPVAFRRPAALPAGVASPAPPGSLRFMDSGNIALINDWRVSDLRRLLQLISVEVARNDKTTLLRLDTGAFRNTLGSGMNAQDVGKAFAAAGFPLPVDVQATLQTWQGRVGRYQLYDQVAVVEFGEDVLPEEMRVIGRLTSAEYYQTGPRCLIFPDPEAAPALVEEMRRRGYTPQVMP